MLNNQNHNHHSNLKLAALLAFLLFASSALEGQAQSKPGPELKTFESQVGEWSYEGAGYANPFGPAGKFTGKSTARLVLGGFFLEWHWKDKNETGYVSEGIVLQGYDSTNKNYFSHMFDNAGSVSVGSLTIEGNTWTTLATNTDKKNGKVYKTRDIVTNSADGKAWTEVAEYSPDDGNTWSPMFKVKGKLVKR